MTVNPKQTAVRQAQLIYSDANIIATATPSALRNLDAGMGGYKTGHTGTNNDGGSIVERLTEAGPDQARRDHATLLHALNEACRWNKQAAALAIRWANWDLDGKTLADRVTAADAGIWCRNCSSKGHKNPKAPEHQECEFCSGFRRDYKQDAPKDVLDLRAAKGRLYEQDITRILARLRDEAKTAKRGAA